MLHITGKITLLVDISAYILGYRLQVKHHYSDVKHHYSILADISA